MKIKQPSTKPRRPITPLRIIVLGLISVVGLVILLIMIVVVQSIYDNYQGHRNVSRLYNEAVQRCGTEPTVVIREDTYKGGTYYAVYTPQHIDYKSKVKTYSDSKLFSSEVVEAYFCNIEQAKQKYGEVLEDSDSNYSEARLLQRKNEITQKLLAGGLQLFRLSTLPQGEHLYKTVLFTDPDYASYSVYYTGTGDIELSCMKLETPGGTSIRSPIVGQDKDGDPIYDESTGGHRQWHIKKQSTSCNVYIVGPFTKQECLAMVQSITPADPSFFSTAEISR